MSLRTCRQGHAIPIHTLLTPFSLSHTYNHNCSIITRFRTFRLDHHRRKDGRTDGRTNRPTVRRFSKSKLGSRIGLGQTRNKRMVQNGIRSIQIFVCPFYKTRPSVRTFESLACSFIWLTGYDKVPKHASIACRQQTNFVGRDIGKN